MRHEFLHRHGRGLGLVVRLVAAIAAGRSCDAGQQSQC
jgi:hypothetical protein